ncbi:MAG: AAA family ATPase [bacterium]|nr:AAA family ATPase [bacterium]
MFKDPLSTLSSDLERLADLLSPSAKTKIEFLEGERREVAILFIDIHGFSTLSEKIDHEQLHKLMFGVMKTLAGVIEQHGGYVDKFEGDLIMALFGAQMASENDSIRAVHCGMKLFEVLEEINKLLKSKMDIQLGARIGINFGWVTVAPDPSGHLTAMGDDVNLAARLESTAEVNTIQVSESVVKECGEYFEWKDLGYIKVKGKSEAVHVFRPIGFGNTSLERWRRSQVVETLPLTGRDTELNLLIQYWQNAISKERSSTEGWYQPEFIEISGDAGIGKSRLMHELEKFVTNVIPDTIVLKGNTTYIAQPPFWLWTTLLKKFFFTSSTETNQHQFESGIEALTSILPSEQKEMLYKNIPYLQNLVSLPIQSKTLQALDDKTLRAETIFVIRNFLKFLAFHKPLLVLLEDLHWLDSGSHEALEFSLKNLHSRHPIVFVGTCRSDYDDGRPVQLFAESSGIIPKVVKMKPLLDEDAEALAKVLLFTYDKTAYRIDDEVLQKLVRYSQGNPFYLEELSLDWLESGLLENQNGIFRLVRPVSDSKVPTSIASLLRARMDRLNKEERQALQECSVLGIEFTQLLFKHVREKIEEHDTGDLYLKELELRSFIKSLLSVKDILYRFRLTTTRNVAYETILIHNRAILHRLTAEALEELAGDQTELLSGLMSFHFELGNQMDKAIYYGLMDLKRQKRTFQNKEGYELAKRLLQLLQDYKEECTDWEERYYATLLLYEAICDTLGKRQEQRSALDELVQFTEGLNNSYKLVEVWLRDGNYHYITANYDTAKQIYLKALELAQHEKYQEWIAAIYGNLGLLFLVSKEYDKAEQNLVNSIVLYHRLGDKRNEAIFLMNLAGLYHLQKRLDLATEKLQLALEKFTLLGNTRAIATTTANFAVLLENQGQLQDAILKNESAITVFREIGDFKGEAIATANLGYCQWKVNEIWQAELNLKKAIQMLQEIQDYSTLSRTYVNLAEVYEQTQRKKELAEIVKEAQPIWEKLKKTDVLTKYKTFME